MASASAISTHAVQIERIKSDILELAAIGRSGADHGIYRMALTDADLEARQWLESRMQAAGLVTRRDGALNLSGTLEGPSGPPRILVGSHIDTVPCAGTLDGTLGVISGLECLRVLGEAGVSLRRSLELIAFTDEEGRFGGMLGSQALCGLVTPETLFQAVDPEGRKLEEVMRQRGLDPMKILDARRKPEEIQAYLELHIEQGPVLDNLGKQVGLVDEITGLFRWLVRMKGTANHAGTTPMDLRQDAFMGLADFAHEVPRILEENGSDRSRATIGRAQILPGAANTVPGLVEFSLDVRDTAPERLEELQMAFRKALQAIGRRRGLTFEFEVQSQIAPVACDPGLLEVLERHARALALDYMRLPSGAAHDAQIMARIAPVTMIFVPSKGGQSHSPAEWTDWADIEAGANLLLQTLLELATTP